MFMFLVPFLHGLTAFFILLWEMIRGEGSSFQLTDILRMFSGNSLVIQWLGLHISTAGDPGSVPGQGAKILQDALCSQKKKII